MITTTEYSQSCPKKVQISRVYSAGNNEAMSFGTAFHKACAEGELPPDADPELEAIFNRWLDLHDPLYGQGKKYPETGFNLKIRVDSEKRISLNLVKKPSGLTIQSTCDEIIIGEEDIFIYERKTTSRDVSTVAEKYLAGSQLKIYNLLGHVLRDLTGKNVVIYLDVIKKKIPGTLHLNKCTKKHGETPCEQCMNTGFVKISSQAIETTPEEYDRVFGLYPHLKTPEAMEAQEKAKMNNFGQIYPMPLQPISFNFIRSLKEKNRMINARFPFMAFSECPECSFSSYCHHGVEPVEKNTKPAPLNDILQILKAVKK